ncbi:uncharacterized protein LOC111870782 [Cryptotermes secundus]|uniref:uncharacterized protein LOC111870782 n=1 Tax=Cryptotermes secundus TaxID=105785 RepID=UPI000CD7C96B|nr:uncharacterized protein LOC111870782 [Cryptotermes secundus]
MTSTSSGETSSPTTASPTKEAGSYDMTQVWIWLTVAIVVFIFLFKFCAWCVQQNRESELTPARSLSTVAIIDAAAPMSMTCPRCECSEYCAVSEQPPSYESLPPAYNEDPPPSYSSLTLQPLPTQEQGLPTAITENHTNSSSRTLHL